MRSQIRARREPDRGSTEENSESSPLLDAEQIPMETIDSVSGSREGDADSANARSSSENCDGENIRVMDVAHVN